MMKNVDIDKDLPKKDLVAIMEVIESAGNCRDKRGAQNLIIRAQNLLDADYCICGLGKILADGILKPAVIINGNYPEEWVDMYKKERFYTKDPVVRFHSRFVMTQLWSDTLSFYKDEETNKFLQHASDFGLKYGISSGIYDAESENTSIFSFASNRPRFSRHHKKVMDILTPHLHNAIAWIHKSGRPVNTAHMSDAIRWSQIM